MLPFGCFVCFFYPNRKWRIHHPSNNQSQQICFECEGPKFHDFRPQKMSIKLESFWSGPKTLGIWIAVSLFFPIHWFIFFQFCRCLLSLWGVGTWRSLWPVRPCNCRCPALSMVWNGNSCMSRQGEKNTGYKLQLGSYLFPFSCEKLI